MNFQRMPGAEVTIDAALVRALLDEQHPDLPSHALVEAGEGWDNKLFRLGADLVVRLPRRQVAAGLIEHEQRWLPLLAPHLPVPISAPVRAGRPGCGFPWAWSVAPWFEGEMAALQTTGQIQPMAVQLAEFLTALHCPAPAAAPVNTFRTSLSSRSDAFVERLQLCAEHVEHAIASQIWRDALTAAPWSGPSLWLHGDMHPGNLLVNCGKLIAVIDFGDMTAGDPAVDLSVAWMLWPESTRRVFRATVNRLTGRDEDAMWRRARGWALHLGLAYLVNSLDNPVMGDIGRRTIAAVLADART